MTVTVEPPAAQQPRHSRRTELVLAAAAVLLVAFVLVFFVRWWTHPDLLPDHGDGMSADPQPVSQAAMAASVTFPRTAAHPATLTFHSAHAVLATDTARARVTFAICHSVRAPEIIGYVGSDLSTYCTDLRPLVDGTRMTYPNPREYVVVVVTPTRRGTTHLVRVDLDYSLDGSHLFRHGTDSVAMDMRLNPR